MAGQILGMIVGAGLLSSVATGTASAQMPMPSSPPTQAFRSIEQPLAVKVGVTIGGLGLIGLELWWFLLSKSRAQPAGVGSQGIQAIRITVDGGYEPSRVTVEAGRLVRLNFFRCDPSSCLEKVVFPEFHIAQDLPLNQVTAIEFTPNQPGEYEFTCGMNMFRGVVEVQRPPVVS